METQSRIRTDAEGVLLLRAQHMAAATRIRSALSNMADAKYVSAYAKLDEACGFLVNLIDMTGQSFDD